MNRDQPLRAPGEPFPVGQDEAAQRCNAALLAGYDYSQYPSAITGYTGQDLQRIEQPQYFPAVRTRVGQVGNYKAGFALLPDGALLIAVCRQDPDPAHESGKGPFQIHVYRSRDEGLTWDQIATPGICGKEPSLAVLPDGTVVMTAQNADFASARRGMLNARSADGGSTWEVDQAFEVKYPRSLTVEADGSLLLCGSVDASDWNMNVCRSTDGGRSWRVEEGKIAWRKEDRARFDEVSAVRLYDGTLLAALRREIPGPTSGEGFEDTMLTHSSDNGRTWSTPWRLSNTAEVHAHLTKLANGHILCTYSNYHLPYGSSAIISRDGGRSWNGDRPVLLFHSADLYVGWAVTLQLPDGSLITSYASTTYVRQPPDTTTCEVVRWRWPE